MDRPVYVYKRTLLQSLREAVVLFVRDILPRLVEQLLCAVQPARVIQSGVYRRMVIVLAIVDGSLLDF